MILAGRLNTPHPYGIDVFEDQIYFTEWTKMGLFKISKYAGAHNGAAVKSLVEDKTEKMTSVAVIHSERQPTCTYSIQLSINAIAKTTRYQT